jgi:tRNA(Ile)-lysidine synthase TilS/MesJ
LAALAPIGADLRHTSIPMLADNPPKTLLRLAGHAIRDFDMIREGDRLLLALSGGKDSLSLLHVLRRIHQRSPVRFELGAATVDPCIDGYDPFYLNAYLKDLEIPYYYQRRAIVARALKTMRGDSFCAYCARMRRGILYATAREQGYNVLVLGQHLDDLAESFLLSAFYGGRLGTMKAHYVIDAGDLRVIRPFVYVRERQTADFAARADLPVTQDNCPACFRVPTQRIAMKKLLAEQENRHERLFQSLLHALKPLMAGQSTGKSGTDNENNRQKEYTNSIM